MMGWTDGVGFGTWVVMALAMVAFWGLVIFAIVAIFRGAEDESTAAPPPEHDPERILDERFARGEIDADEYHVRQNVLRAPHRVEHPRHPSWNR